MTTGTIFDIKRFAIHDGPGIRTTVFFKGCPLTCCWCHNPESQSTSPELLYRQDLCETCGECVYACPTGALKLAKDGVVRNMVYCDLSGECADVCPSEAFVMVGRQMTADQLMAEIEKDTPFYDQSRGGVTFSGGEPLAQADFLAEVLDRCGERDIHRVVDTCGLAPAETMRFIAERTDAFLFDLKLMDPAEHLRHTGVDNGQILENLRMLAEMGGSIQVRVPVIPTITDDPANLDAIGRFVSTLTGPPGVTLLRFHPTAMGKYERFGIERRLPDGISAPSEEALAEVAARIGAHGVAVDYETHEPREVQK
jgi:pyruvate formate lyase activating enzyme